MEWLLFVFLFWSTARRLSWKWIFGKLTSSEKSPRCLTSSTSVRSWISSRDTTFFVLDSRTRPSARGVNTVRAFLSLSGNSIKAPFSTSDGKFSSAFGPSTSSPPKFRRCEFVNGSRNLVASFACYEREWELTSTDSLSRLSVSSVVFVSTMGPESCTTLPSSSTTCRLTRVSICFVVVNSVFFFVTTSSAGKKKKKWNKR